MEIFLKSDNYIDYNHETIQNKSSKLFSDYMTNIEKVKMAYKFFRDEIPHSFDCDADVITVKASDVLKHKTGFCFQHITLSDDDLLEYCIHAYNAIFLNNRWIKLDARGNKQNINAQFSIN